MSYEKRIEIGFGQCDPAGIVFYPRYFEMINATVEGFFRDRIGWSFSNINGQAGQGVPTVTITCEFHAPSRVDDLLAFRLQVSRVGGASASFKIQAFGVGEVLSTPRLTADLTLCWVDGGRATPWPEPMRAHLLAAQHLSHEEVTL